MRGFENRLAFFANRFVILALCVTFVSKSSSYFVAGGMRRTFASILGAYLVTALTLLLLTERRRKRFELLLRPLQQHPQIIPVNAKFPADRVLVLFL